MVPAPPTEPELVPPVVSSAPASAAVLPGDTDALTCAFAAGLGDAALPSLRLTPELMERIGAVLREATQGTLDLVRARALTKGEMRAEATLIAPRDNNPLKFSPDAATALAHLLGERRSAAFLAPVAAMRDAFDDLRAHQFGFMAGLRAALAGVLKQFDPVTLEQRLTHKSILDSVLPINRRAKLWDCYEQLYRDIATEAEDDFHALFGREFLRAYEEQVARLARHGNDSP